MEQLVLDKYRLKKVVEKKITQHRQSNWHKIYQSLLFGEKTEVAVTPDIFFPMPLIPGSMFTQKPTGEGINLKSIITQK